MSNVVALPGVGLNDNAVAYNKDVVRMLEVLLADAKAGKVQFVGVAWVSDGSAYKAWAPNYGSAPMLTAAMGAVNYLNAGFAAAIIEGEIDSVLKEDDDGSDNNSEG